MSPLFESNIRSPISSSAQRSSAALAKVSAAEAEINRIQEVSERIRRAANTVKRVAAEAIDNRLEAIRPLLTELYSRLRPHADWSEISYHICGDVKRFLGLRVGEDLNLRFMFSSGQRRAAGLAFLLSLRYLAGGAISAVLFSTTRFSTSMILGLSTSLRRLQQFGSGTGR